MIKIAITDDHQLFLDGIREMLSSMEGFDLLFTATTGQETLEKLQVQLPDVILLDISLPDMDGVELCQEVVSRHPGINVLALTMHKEVSFLKQMLNHGAKGYLLKNTKKEELLEAIRTVYEGETYFSDEITKDLYNSMIHGEQNKSGLPKLSRREKEVLQLIIDEYTTQEIADQLFITLSTVESHRANLLAKLDVRNTAGLVRVAIEKKLLD
ncbi:MAG: response regulator transcription factor [Flavobacteriales bacterium]|nr:response regulator transcription factor [Flavobacteriales bacterium]